jgi:DNA topoisomerase-1
VSYSLPSAGFIEPMPEHSCPTCHGPRVKIIFRGQRPDLFCLEPSCVEHQRQFQFGTCSKCGSALALRYSFAGKRFVGCSGYPDCRVTYPLPQRGKLEKDHPPCPACGGPVVTAIEAGRPPWTLCINPACPTRAEAEQRKAERKKAAAAKRRRKGSVARKRARTGSTPRRSRRRPAASEEAAARAEGVAAEPVPATNGAGGNGSTPS